MQALERFLDGVQDHSREGAGTSREKETRESAQEDEREIHRKCHAHACILISNSFEWEYSSCPKTISILVYDQASLVTLTSKLLSHLFFKKQGKILDLTGHNKQKDKPEKSEKDSKKDGKGKSRKNSSMSFSMASGGGDDVDSSEADLVAILANQVVKDEIKKLGPGLRAKKKGAKSALKKKISEFV